MLRYVVILVIVILVVRYFIRKKKKETLRRGSLPDAETLRQDPVCGRYVPEVQGLVLKSGGHVYHFCSRECMRVFKEQPR